jgi:hypothetical protein
MAIHFFFSNCSSQKGFMKSPQAFAWFFFLFNLALERRAVSE